MKKGLAILILLLCGASLLHGQVADSTSMRKQGEPVFVTGKAIMLSGAAAAAAGGGVMLLAISPLLNPPVPEGEFRENMLAPMVYIIGGLGLMGGVTTILAGIPVTVVGNSMMKCDVPWREARYDGPGAEVILEGGFYLPDVLEARATLGYNFNPHIFLGAGVAPGCWLQKDTFFSLPVYADFRWSMCNRMISPYLGASAGIELADDPFSPYLATEIGARIRTDHTSNTHSFWTAIAAEVAGGYMRVGLKMGCSF